MEMFYDNLQTVPKLISDLALSVAEAQRRLDQEYMENLAEFLRLVASLESASPPERAARQLVGLFRAMAPSRYQFTETAVEVRADLQMGSMSEFHINGGATVRGAVFAVAVNAAYARRSAYDTSASALIRTVLNAVAADPGTLDKLLTRAGETPHAEGPVTPRYQELADAFRAVLALAPAAANVPLPAKR
jgi:hypothetical protein